MRLFPSSSRNSLEPGSIESIAHAHVGSRRMSVSPSPYVTHIFYRGPTSRASYRSRTTGSPFKHVLVLWPRPSGNGRPISTRPTRPPNKVRHMPIRECLDRLGKQGFARAGRSAPAFLAPPFTSPRRIASCLANAYRGCTSLCTNQGTNGGAAVDRSVGCVVQGHWDRACSALEHRPPDASRLQLGRRDVEATMDVLKAPYSTL